MYDYNRFKGNGVFSMTKADISEMRPDKLRETYLDLSRRNFELEFSTDTKYADERRHVAEATKVFRESMVERGML